MSKLMSVILLNCESFTRLKISLDIYASSNSKSEWYKQDFIAKASSWVQNFSNCNMNESDNKIISDHKAHCWFQEILITYINVSKISVNDVLL